MRFTKMHGIGNDYIYINCFEERVEDPGALSVRMSRPHFGVGSDGVILICPSDVADFAMRMYNSDGSESEMCGNGIRCLGRYVYERGLTKKTSFTVMTGGGLKQLELKVSGGKVQSVRVDMGSPVLTPELIPTTLTGEMVMGAALHVGGANYKVHCVSMGNPHCVVFVKDPDGSVWCDLTADGLDRKLLLRSDGTSVYMTQDLGTAERRFSEYKLDSHVYVVGNEQNYHFQVLKLILGKLGFKRADDIFHLSYGMVELPEGKMKSREGTVVDADDLLEQMYDEARKTSEESGKLADMSDDEKAQLYRMIGLGALKYFIIKVDPKKTMLFNPKESIDFNGNTGPFIQYTHARIKSILRKADDQGISHKAADVLSSIEPSAKETRLIKLLSTYPAKVAEAGAAYSPAVIANYAYDLAKEFNQYYHDTRILQEEDQDVRRFRLVLIQTVAEVLVKAMDILGIQLPERM